MRKNIIIVFFFCFIGTAYSQDWIIDTLDNKNIYIKKGDYEAVIFDVSIPKVKIIFPENISSKEKETYLKKHNPAKNRWNPTIADVEKAEPLIKEFLAKQNTKIERKLAKYHAKKKRLEERNIDKEIYLTGFCPNYDCRVLDSIDEYVRQYQGIKDKMGNKILYVNFISKKELNLHPYWKKGWVSVCDGGFDYWQIKVNLKRKRCFEMDVNGIGG